MTDIDNDKKLKALNEEILNIFLEYRHNNPEFTFAIKKNNNKSYKEDQCLFKNGNEVICSPYKKERKGGHVRSIAFVMVLNSHNDVVDHFIRLSFGGYTHREFDPFYTDLIKVLEPLEKKSKYIYLKKDSKSYRESLRQFLEKTVPEITQLIKEHHCENEFMYTEKEFLKKIENIKQKEKDFRQDILLHEQFSHYIPDCKDMEKIYEKHCKPDEAISENKLFDLYESDNTNETLAPNWREFLKGKCFSK